MTYRQDVQLPDIQILDLIDLPGEDPNIGLDLGKSSGTFTEFKQLIPASTTGFVAPVALYEDGSKLSFKATELSGVEEFVILKLAKRWLEYQVTKTIELYSVWTPKDDGQRGVESNKIKVRVVGAESK